MSGSERSRATGELGVAGFGSLRAATAAGLRDDSSGTFADTALRAVFDPALGEGVDRGAGESAFCDAAVTAGVGTTAAVSRRVGAGLGDAARAEDAGASA